MRTITTLLACCTLISIAGLRADEPKLEQIHVGEPIRLEVFPPAVKLAGAQSRMQLVVTGHYADGGVQDLTRASRLASTASDVVSVENQAALPRRDGRAQLAVIA